jgi:hypothetical protein
MSTLVTRAGKGSPLTHNEVDTNFTNLNTDKVEKTSAAITGGTINGTSVGATTASTGRFSDLTDTGLTSGRVIYASTGGNLVDSANLTFDGTTLVANDFTDSSLTATRVVYAGTGGNLVNASNFTYDGTNLVAGAIQNTPIGGTTPAAGTFTTLTAQTEVLKGTGQNLITYSQDFSNAAWTKLNSTISGTLFTAPDGTTTANKLQVNTTNGQHAIYRFYSSSTNITFTESVYLKAGEITWVLFSDLQANAFYINLSTGALGSNIGSPVNPTVTSVGSGWYRVSFTFTNSLASQGVGIYAASGNGTFSFAGANTTDGLYLWGAQLEVGSTLNTYIPTTTTAVYGTPTLSFSGVSTIGLQSDGSLYVSPAGTGAIQAQATTSSATGGNARGANAVDWQTARNSASSVASNINTVVGGGFGNTASGGYAVVAGGLNNTASGIASAITGGSSLTSSGTYSASVGGNSNTNSGYYGSLVGGQSNTSAGYYNFIGGGFTNSGTSGSAVTTQSGTMNGTTAVTLSGSNANIKVGQLITGTSIAIFTYVAAISGTSLTLSQAASGSSTSTLSFYTPHGVVVGGGNNQATGSYSFIGGGGDAGTAANRNVASGDWSFVGGGRGNSATGSGAVIGGGGVFSGAVNVTYPQTASGSASFIGGGLSNIASGAYASVLAGLANTANGIGSTAVGLQATTRGITGYYAYSGCDGAVSFTSGTSQTGLLTLGRQTTDATPTVLTSNTNAGATTNQVILPNNSAYYFKGSVIANVTGAANGASWSFEGAIMRGANAASTVLIGTPAINRVAATAGATAWVIALTADTTNGGLAVTVTGAASTTIRFVAKVETTEVTF